MIDDLGWVDLGVKPDADGFGRSLSGQIDGDLDQVGRSAGKRFGAGFKKVAVAGIGAGLVAGAAAIKFGAGALEEANEARLVGAQTDAVLKSTGEAANTTAKQIGNLSGRLSNMAAVDDELIQSGANVLLTFTKIRNEAGKGNKIFDLATKASLNMSTALKKDLSSSATQVGKALNDPVKGVTALAKAGVQFTAQQRAQIKALVEGGDANAAMALGLIDTTTTYNNLLKENGNDATKVAQILKTDLTPAQKKAFDMYAEGGKTMEAQKRILKELDTQFAGSAKSQATESEKLQVAFGNLQEEIGTELLPYMDDLAKFIRKDGIPAVRDFAGWVREDGVPAIKKIAGFTKDAASSTKELIGFLNDLPDPAKYAGLVALVGGVGAAKLRGGRGGALGTVGAAVGLAKPIRTFETNPLALGGGAGGAAGGAVRGGALGAAASTVKSLALPAVAAIAIAGGATVSIQKLSSLLAPDETAAGRAGTPGANNSPLTDGIDLDRTAADKDAEEKIITLTGRVNGLNDALLLVGNKKIRPEMDDREIVLANKRLGEFLSKQVDAGKPITPYINTSSIERALTLVAALKDGMHGVPTAGTDGGVPFLSGGNREVGGDKGYRAGVVIDQRGSTIQAHNYDDFVEKSDRKAREAGLGGRPR